MLHIWETSFKDYDIKHRVQCSALIFPQLRDINCSPFSMQGNFLSNKMTERDPLRDMPGQKSAPLLHPTSDTQKVGFSFLGPVMFQRDIFWLSY